MAAVAATLGSILEAGDDVVRCAAVECLEHLLPGPAEDLLIGCLTDPDVDVRILAARALGAATTSDQVGAALLHSVIADPSGEVKEAAIRSIARLGYRGDLAPLRRLAVDRDPDMAWDNDEAGEWDQWLDVQVAAIEAFGQLGDAEAVPAIVAALDDEVGQDVEPQAFAALAHLGRAGIEALAPRLEHGSVRSRRRAASALARSSDPAAVPIQKSLLDSQDPEIRRAAAVRVMADHDASTSVAPFLRDPDPAIRREAVRRAPADQIVQVVGLAGDANEGVRLAVIVAMSAQTPEVLNVAAGMLRDRLNDTSDGVAAAAAAALAGITDDLTRRSLRDVAQDRARAPSVRAAAVGAIGEARDRQGLDALTAYVDDADHLVRFSALHGLCNAAAQRGELGEASLKLLFRHLAEPPEPEDDPAAEADDVAEVSAPESPPPPPQQQHLGETSTLQAIERANLAPQAAAPASPPMVCELDDDEARFLSLAENMPRRTRPNLTPDVPMAADRRRCIARLLADVRGADIVDSLVDALATPDRELRLAAASTLSQHADLAVWARQAGSMEPLIVLAEAADPNLRVFAARILARVAESAGHASAAEAIDRLLNDPVPAVIREAFAGAGNSDHARVRANAVLASADTLTGAAALGWMVRTGEPGALAAAVNFALTREGWDPVHLAEILPEADWSKAIDHLAAIARSAANPLVTVAALNAIKSLAGP